MGRPRKIDSFDSWVTKHWIEVWDGFNWIRVREATEADYAIEDGHLIPEGAKLTRRVTERLHVD